MAMVLKAILSRKVHTMSSNFRLRWRYGSLPTLNTLSLSSSTAADNVTLASVLANIIGKTVGSTIVISPGDGRITVSSDSTQLLRGSTSWVDGAISITLTETLSGAIGSPRSTVLTFTVVAPGGKLDLSNKNQTAFDLTLLNL